MDRIITESGMDFIAKNSFHIENSALFTQLGEGIKSVEFIRIMESRLLFIEAKTTFPNPNTPSTTNSDRFHDEIGDIRDKFIHSLNALSSVEVGVSQSGFDGSIKLPKRVTLEFWLVIRKHESAWCRSIENALMEAFPLYLKKIWRPTIFVINRECAVKKGLIVR